MLGDAAGWREGRLDSHLAERADAAVMGQPLGDALGVEGDVLAGQSNYLVVGSDGHQADLALNDSIIRSATTWELRQEGLRCLATLLRDFVIQ
eukprot:CAMPEP_0206494338 /NCGR_PEP_ID=MMETSP0324_2-20121206/47656_1 /ASSEMBLY_ACC=CAM_ASM_000836 /TAXON_ID=2866 /ORGANISM="Crypthecodinium cohnii, Strain Seligo" /LENGTH=92 /DNA_ID=CAMNT_0053977949 /DNA_START=163 /DNA_END=441 /DNA_ORIENTATION=+